MAYKKLTTEQKKINKESKRQEILSQTHKEINGIDYKICNMCNEYKIATAEYFYFNKSNSIDYLSSRCIICEKKASRQWAIDNPEKYYISNARKDTKLKKILYKRELSKQRRLDGRHQAWLDKNPDKVKKYSQDRYHNKIHKITNKEWESCKMYFCHRCAYCGLPIEEHWITRMGKLINMDLHKEHKNHDGSNGLDNCIPSCQSCNDKKWKFEFDDWYNQNNPNFTQERLDKINQWLNEDYKNYFEI